MLTCLGMKTKVYAVLSSLMFLLSSCAKKVPETGGTFSGGTYSTFTDDGSISDLDNFHAEAISSSKMKLSWTPLAATDAKVVIDFKKQSDPDSSYYPLPSNPITELSATVSDLNSSTDYTFRAFVILGSKRSSAVTISKSTLSSTAASLFSPPSLVLDSASLTSVPLALKIYWDLTGISLQKIKVERTFLGSSLESSDQLGNLNQFIDNGSLFGGTAIEKDKTYSYRVKFWKSTGEESAWSDAISVVTPSDVVAPLPIAQNFASTAVEPLKIHLNWTYSNPTTDKIQSIKIQRKLASASAFTDVATLSTQADIIAHSYDDAGVTFGNSYLYKLILVYTNGSANQEINSPTAMMPLKNPTNLASASSVTTTAGSRTKVGSVGGEDITRLNSLSASWAYPVAGTTGHDAFTVKLYQVAGGVNTQIGLPVTVLPAAPKSVIFELFNSGICPNNVFKTLTISVQAVGTSQGNPSPEVFSVALLNCKEIG